MKMATRRKGKEKIIIFCPNRKRAKRKIAKATNVLIILPIFFQIFSSYNTAQQKTSHHKQRLPKRDTKSCPHLLVIKHFQVIENKVGVVINKFLPCNSRESITILFFIHFPSHKAFPTNL